MSDTSMTRSWKSFLLILTVGCLLSLAVFISFTKFPQSSPRPADYEESGYRKFSQTPLWQFEKEIRRRVEHIEEGCKKLSKNRTEFESIEKSKLDHIVVDDRYQVLYCYVPKVACTNLKRVFLMLTGKMNVTDPLELKSSDVHSALDKYLTYLDSLPSSGIKYRIMHYKKVIFVREPLERVLSAFRNKFVQKGNSYFKERFGKMIMKRYHDNQIDETENGTKTITFPEFVQYLLDPRTKAQGFNEHWESFYKLCHPCHIHYNFVGKYEDIDKDVNGLLQILQIHDKIPFPKRDDLYKTLKTEDILTKFYKDLDPSMLLGLLEIYAKDYSLFNYEIPFGITELLKSN